MSNNFSNPSIKNSVGVGGQNKPSDAFIVQRLLNECKTKFKGQGKLVPDGRPAGKTYKAIKEFQKTVVKMKVSDGRIDPTGNSFKKLLSERDPELITLNNKIAVKNTMTAIKKDLFIALYEKEFSDKKLSDSAKKGLTYLITRLNADVAIVDIRWAAYMLATVKHECGNKYQPITESGKGNYYSKKKKKQIVHDYSKVIKVLDPVTNKTNDNIYYGRGYVQLTWERNYKKLGAALNLGNKLHITPDLALDKDIAYNIMSYGMRNASFTKYNLKNFIVGSYTDYVGARKIINGKDKDQLIAGYAKKLELLLKLSEVEYLTFLKRSFNITDWAIKNTQCKEVAFSKVLSKY